ncbi:MAG TPA: hypothetical protein VFX49_10190, partial [Chloroflexota bacterium]|nr:hypothetical protein [Chloroflexota bacterium]
ELRTLAQAAGWRVEKVAAAVPTATAAPATAPVPPIAALAPRVDLPRLALKLPAAPSARVASVVGVAGVVVLALGTLLSPNASVTVVPTSEQLQIELPVIVDPSAKKVDAAAGRLPGRTISRELSESATAPATGKKTVPDGKASGEVVLLNRSESAVSVPKGTVVLAGTVKFATLSDVTVAPSRRAGAAQTFGMATTRVQAVTGGAAGNVDRNKIDRIEGALSASLSVQNTAALRGGSERQMTYVTEDDRRRLQERLFQSLAEKVMQQVKKDLPASDKETAVAWSGQNPAVVEASFSKAADEEAQSVALTLKVRYGATVFSNDAYNQLVKQQAQANAGTLRPGYVIAKETVQAEPPAVGGVENGTVRLVGRVRATATQHVDTTALRGALAGKPVETARDALGQLPGLAGYELSVRNPLPGPFSGRMPSLGWRISVQSRPAV